MRESLVLTGGTVMPMDQPEFIGDVLIEDGKIVKIGSDIQTPQARKIDVTGKYVIPGLIDAHTHVGMVTSGTTERDHNELTDPITPHMRAIDSIYPMDKSFTEALSSGITTCVTGPGSMNVIGGSFAALKTAGNTVEKKLLRDNVGMKTAVGENPKTYCPNNPKYPKSRMGIAALIRQTLVDAQNYKYRVEAAKKRNEPFAERNLAMEAMVPVIEGKMPLKIHCHRMDDILTAIRICNEFSVKYTLDHCTEGHLITEELFEAEKNLCQGVIVGPLNIFKRKTEVRNIDAYNLPKVLYEAGVFFAIATDYFEVQPDSLILFAALAASAGLPDEEALKAVTINAAKITGISDRVGSITVGKDADIAVFSKHPLDVKAKCQMTIVNGEIAFSDDM